MEYFKVFDNLITPRLTMRAEGDNPTYENCFFELPGAGAKTLEGYYDDMDGADNPFSAITIKGKKGTQWKWTSNGNLRLNHNKVWKSGAAQVKVKSGYAVKLRITVGEEDFILGKQDRYPIVQEQSTQSTTSGKGLTRRERFVRSDSNEWDEVIEWPVVGRDDSPVFGKEQVDVVLVGDSGDYLSMDLEGAWEGIAKFRLKLGNETYANVGISDINGNSYIEVLGVCKITETSESGGRVKLPDYRGYPMYRDETDSIEGDDDHPYKIEVKDRVTGLITVKKQFYSQRSEADGAINMAKIWIDEQLANGGGGSDVGGSDVGGSDVGGSDVGGSGQGESPSGSGSGSGSPDVTTDLRECPSNSSQNDVGECECDSGYKLDPDKMECVKKEDSMSDYIVLGGLALLGLALLG